MYRFTITFLVIFLVTNHPFAVSRSVQFETAHDLMKHFEKTNYDDDEEMECTKKIFVLSVINNE